MFSEAAILIFLLLLSAFFSSTEIAYIVANKIKIEIRARRKNIYAQNAFYFIKYPDYFFSSILIANNAVNITFASLSSVFLISFFGLEEFEILVLSTFLILFFGELIPKFVGREMADSLILVSSIPLRVIFILLFPIVKLTTKISAIINRLNIKEEEEILQIFDKEDIQNLIEESSEAGKMDASQSDIISRVIEIKEQRVYEAITPRTDIVGIEITSSVEAVIDKFIETGYSKLIVYEENLDNIRGMVLLKDFFRKPVNLSSVIRDIIFVPDTKKSLEMLNEFLDKQFTLAVVVDEFGGTAGILTIEDLIEELFGEIRDEYDEEDQLIRKIDSNTYLLSGKVEIDYLIDEYNFELPEGEYETIAGFVTSKLGRIPVKGENFKIDRFSILILKSNRTKIDLMKITVHSELTE